jgi:hypothetical protein
VGEGAPRVDPVDSLGSGQVVATHTEAWHFPLEGSPDAWVAAWRHLAL